MSDRVTSHTGAGLPAIIPVFPLEGVLLLPRGQLPLNIFEPRYVSMIEDALKGDRLVGMIQPRAAATQEKAPALYDVGCVGRITSFNETSDHRYLITLTGLSRFQVRRELPRDHQYRLIEADWSAYGKDSEPAGVVDFDRDRMRRLLSIYFDMHGLSCDWGMIENAPDERLITCLSMICPLEPCEKQALLEADSCSRRAGLFISMLELAVRGGESPDRCGLRH